MPHEVYDRNHTAGADANSRIQRRLMNRGAGSKPDETSQTWPSRTITNIHPSGYQHQKQPVNKERK